MQAQETTSAQATRNYYERRYAGGYMDRWETERRVRLLDVLEDVTLPAGARILDYGAGSGALTGLLVERWPDASVIGVDVSETAVARARQRHAADDRIDFAVLDDEFVERHANGFDFVFSHHVLEHVHDLDVTISDLAAMVAPGGRMLHALPCGNAGSLAHWLATSRPDGIDPTAGDRFYFEEDGHLRRLRSADLAARFAGHGLTVQRSAFGYHWFGCLRLFTEFSPHELLALLDPRRCHRARLPQLLALLFACLLLAAARLPVQLLIRLRRRWCQVFRYRTRRCYEPSGLLLAALAPLALCLWPLSAPVEATVRWADAREWRIRRRDPRGSEMLLEFAPDEVNANASPVETSAGKDAAGSPECSAAPA